MKLGGSIKEESERTNLRTAKIKCSIAFKRLMIGLTCIRFKPDLACTRRKAYRRKFLFSSEGGFGMNELLGIAAALLLAAFIIIPGLQTFAGSVMTRLTAWWQGTIITRIFPTSV